MSHIRSETEMLAASVYKKVRETILPKIANNDKSMIHYLVCNNLNVEVFTQFNLTFFREKKWSVMAFKFLFYLARCKENVISFLDSHINFVLSVLLHFDKSHYEFLLKQLELFGYIEIDIYNGYITLTNLGWRFVNVLTGFADDLLEIEMNSGV